MNNVSKTLILAAAAAFATPAVTRAAVPSTATQNVPGTMNYQGVLRNPSTGLPYADGIYTLDLRIWNNSSSTSSSGCLWGGQYSVYVKDGYFNVMLGDTAGKDLTTAPTGTYKNQELWKAMWGANDTATTYYLGVTPREDYRNAAIASPSEILPRQQLLSSPFAFRAQQAKYADGSKATTFTAENGLMVNGATTLKGAVTFNGNITASGTGSQKFGPIATSSTSVALTGNTVKPTSSTYSAMQSVYDVGKYLYFYSYYNMEFAPTAGNMNFTVPSGYNMNISGAGSLVSTAAATTIGGTGNTTISSGGTATLKHSNGVGAVKVGSYYTDVTNSSVRVQSQSVMTLSSDSRIEARAPYLFGQGQLRWAPAGKTLSNGNTIPFQIRPVAVTINKGQQYATATIEADSSHKWVYAGYIGPSTAVGPNEIRAKLDGSTWKVQVYLSAAAAYDQTWTVQCLGIHKDFVNDQR